MKKQLLTLAIIGSSIAAMAQTWSQDFSSATAPGLPATWMQNNVDGFTVHSSLSSFSFATNAWVTRTSNDPAHTNVVVSTSYYTPAHTSNDWLITPSFTVPANAVLEWDAYASDPNYPDGYQVKISTTGTAVADFSTNLLTIGAENSTWTNRGLSLNAYSGQTVHIAFVNNSNDMFLLILDNIKVLVPQVNDGSVIDITGLNRYAAGVSTQQNVIAGTFKSLGYSPANNAVLNYKVNNNATVTETISFSSALNYAQTGTYSFTTLAPFALGVNKIKTWVSQVNGVNEIAVANDTAYATAYVASTSKPRNALVEEFSSSTCVPCANLNVTFDPLLNSNNPNVGGNFNVIKYQVNWPSPGNDPSYNYHGRSRVLHYGINAAPTALTNGKTEMMNTDQAEINAAIAEPAFADITASLNVTGNTISASATITPYLTITGNSPLRVHQALIQRFYNYPGAVTSQKNYHHVMRKMSPDAWGAPTTVSDGVSFNASFTHTVTTATTPVQLSYDFWNAASTIYEYVVFVQDSISNDILQSGSASYTVSSVGLVDLKADQKIGVYPNPAKDFAAIAIDIQKSALVDITVFDISGKLVYSNKSASVQAGKSEIKINTSDFSPGVYTVQVTTNDGTLLKDKLIIQ